MREKTFRKFLIVFVFAVLFTLADAQRLPVRVFTSSDGLGSSFVDFLAADSRGFLWFCTRDGLSRFDGAEFVTYQIGEGIVAPGVESIYETRAGVYWIVTTGGLYRFRAETLSKPRAADAARPVLNAEFVGERRGFLFEDSRRNLYLSAGKLFRIVEAADGTVEFVEIRLNLPAAFDKPFAFSEIKEAPDGSLWIKTTLGIVRLLPDARTVFYPFNGNVFESTVNHIVDHQGRVWLSVGREFYIINPAPAESFAGAESTTVLALKPARTIRLDAEKPELPGAPDEIFQYDDENFLEKHPGKYIFQAADKTVWLTTTAELIEFDGTRFQRYGAEQGLLETRRMTEDSAGNLWIGGAKGLMRLARRGLRTFKAADGLRSSYLYTVQQDADGAIYTIQGGHLVGRLDGDRFQTVALKVKPDARFLWASRGGLRSRRSGEWWIASQDGLYRFPAVADFQELANKSPLARYDKTSGLKSTGVFQVYEDRRGKIWISTRGNVSAEEGLTRFDPETNEFYTFSERDDYPPGKAPAAFAEDADGNLWISFYQGGIARFDGGKFTVYGEREKIPAALISDLLFDRRGALWLASPLAGLLRIDNPQAGNFEPVFYNTGSGLASNNVRTITEDRFGNIYAGTVRGVDRLTPGTGRVRHYAVADGLAGDFVVDSLCDRDGNVWFATMDGLSRLMPPPETSRAAPPVRIGALAVDWQNRPVAELGSERVENVELAPTENNLQIDFFGLNFEPGENLRYQYRLEGADADWSQPSVRRSVAYAKLAPGEYRFLVRAVNADGAASENPAVVSFVVRPPFWRTTWFLLFSTVAVCAVLFLIYRYRTKNLRRVNAALTEAKRAEEDLSRSRKERLVELEKVRSRIATDLHDDIGSSLTQIAVLSEVARTQAAQFESEVLQAPLERIKGVSRELVEAMSDIVWAINPQKDHLRDLVQRMRRFGSDVCNGRGIHFELNAPPVENDLRLGANVRREVFAIFKEAVNNAVKYSECRRVAADFLLDADALTLKIADDGRGFDTETVLSDDFAPETGGNGLVNMRRRAAELGGACRIESAAGKGTTVTLDAPLHAPEKDFRAPAQSGGENRNDARL